MNALAVTLAKLSGIRKALNSAMAEESGRGRVQPYFANQGFAHYFQQAFLLMNSLKEHSPSFFSDFHHIEIQPDHEVGSPPERYYSRAQLQSLIRDIDQIFEIRANSELTTLAKPDTVKNRVFITHGRSNDWREVQSYIEKDVKLQTLELAQEPSQGMTIIEKLLTGANRCDSAVIVMSGDDIDSTGQARARENVMHEIGFFQGKYGRAQVILLHEDGVSVPTNLSGVVYVPFPKGTISAGFHVLMRELRALYPE